MTDRHALAVIAAVAEAMGVPAGSVLGRGRAPRLVHARRTAALLLRRAGLSYARIGHILAERDPTTARASIVLGESMFIDLPGFRAMVLGLEAGGR